jgi:hypothetical protein
MGLAPYCAHAGVAATHTIAADQTNIEMVRIRMIRLAPVGYVNCVLWVERSAACWVGGVRIPCGIALAQQKATKRAAFHFLALRRASAQQIQKTSRAFPVFRIDSQFGDGWWVESPGVHFTVSVRCFPGL